MVGSKNSPSRLEVLAKAEKIRLVLTDCDGVLTDGSVYYSERGESLKRFNIRDGMGVERLRMVAGVETGIITGELSESVKRRAEKLKITCLELGCKDKVAALEKWSKHLAIAPEQIAFIGDDVNDLGILALVGLSASPRDAFQPVKDVVDFVCNAEGGRGAFRELAEFILSAKALTVEPVGAK